MPDPITQKISKSHQRTASRLLAEAAAEAPVEHTEESPSPADLPAPLMDPAAITAAIEAGRYAADRRDSVEFLTRLAEGIAERIATYHKMAKDPRVAQLATLLSNIDVEKFTAFCPGHGAVLGEATKAVNIIRRWGMQAHRAEDAAARIPRLRGEDCRRYYGWQENGIWSPEVDKLSKWLLDVGATQEELEKQLVAAQEALGRAIALYAGAPAQYAGVPLVKAKVEAEP